MQIAIFFIIHPRLVLSIIPQVQLWELVALITLLLIILISVVQRSVGTPWSAGLRLNCLMPVAIIGIHLSLLAPMNVLPTASSSFRFKVMSFNVCASNGQNDAILDLIQKESPDLLLLQEITPSLKDVLIQVLASSYPANEFYFDFVPRDQQMIISRYPLTPMGAAKEQARAQKVRIDTLAGPILVWNVHASRMNEWEKHYQQLQALAEAIRAVNTPLIVGGDFNAPNQSVTYNLVTEQVNDTQWMIGGEIHPTFPALTAAAECQFTINGIKIPPIVRIDHIFFSEHFKALSSGILSTSGGSDHLPITARLEIK